MSNSWFKTREIEESDTWCRGKDGEIVIVEDYFDEKPLFLDGPAVRVHLEGEKLLIQVVPMKDKPSRYYRVRFTQKNGVRIENVRKAR